MIDNSIEKIIHKVKKEFGNSNDIISRIIYKKKKKIGYIFLESVSSDDKISNFINKSIIKNNNKNLFFSFYNNINNNIYNSNIKECKKYKDLFYFLSSGYTVIIFENENKCIAVETKSDLDRGITEASSEPIIRGPKDSFTENHNKNIGLIRKRIKDNNLWIRETKVGLRTQTKVSIIYLNKIVSKKKINLILKKIKKINIDGIIDTGYIREFLDEKQKSLFPRAISTERPDLVCTSILDGKIVILVENSPFALILPAVLKDFFHSPEDYYQKPFNASFSRIIRLFCFILALLTPAFYISFMTYNHNLIPDQLLISLAIQRESVPFSTSIEILLFILTFELLREADIHAPTFSGSAMNVVGALVLGDAAVSAGIVSPIVIIVVAITSIGELVFYDVDIINALREWRILFILSSSILGLIGVILMFLIFITKLSSLECLGTPFLAPLSPFLPQDFKDSIIRRSRKFLSYRPSYLKKNSRKLGG